MSEAVPLGALYEAHLDDAELAALLTDLELAATILDVRVKGAATTRSDGRHVPLADAARQLRSGQALGVQIHYRHRGKAWTDTLMSTATGVRIVRCEVPSLVE